MRLVGLFEDEDGPVPRGGDQRRLALQADGGEAGFDERLNLLVQLLDGERAEPLFIDAGDAGVPDEIEFDIDTYRDDAYRSQVGTYYGSGGAGWQDW